MKKPLVSICCTTYNHASYIKDCLEGFLMQETSFTYEILIYDDASTDGTSAIIEDYRKRFPDLIFPVRPDENQYSKGVRGMNFNFNIPRAKGKYIALCEGDDYWTAADKLARQVQFMEENPNVIFTFHNFKKKYGEELASPFFYPSRFLEDSYILNFKESFSTQVQPLTMLFRNVVKNPEGIKVLNGDALLIALLLEKGKAAYLNFVGAHYRIHEGGIHGGQPKYNRVLNSVASRKKMIKYFDQPVKGMLYHRLALFYKQLAKLDYKDKKIIKCVFNLGRMYKYSIFYFFSSGPKLSY
ncbi:glycosyltransferase [uncultured Cyclobacterium sp.]|uniref:glycosyltransferase family 2 protein n=1 Tax=uncultured Cyclobacterium sp. TaxID=453820 RepID=UPI0030EC552A